MEERLQSVFFPSLLKLYTPYHITSCAMYVYHVAYKLGWKAQCHFTQFLTVLSSILNLLILESSFAFKCGHANSFLCIMCALAHWKASDDALKPP